MMFVTHVIGKRSKLDGYNFGSVTCGKYQHDMICQHKKLFEIHDYWMQHDVLEMIVYKWNMPYLMPSLMWSQFSVQEEENIEHMV